ncbi:MAG: hypothetical protein LKE33_09170 [Acidaminococcus sp.]|jgi:hypothetical protein|nr:hypothetical protein [Acidaminococcus sp.]MCI2099435.1 hypothetical protein [Acidaminococcus sp.]MCI2113795.1 hypothetical protein [Acidaminococcus sp.]MCI2115631.1 hypothetical protein [Acidaminococcus sp.]
MTDIHSIVRLLKNHLYPTYQLHAVMANKRITPEDGLKRGALTVIDWVCQRLGGDVPSSLQVPKPEEYANFDSNRLVSVHLNYGFVIDIVSLPEKGIWSLQITEPDLGSDPGNPHQGRQPVAGRIFETDVAFLVQDNELEIGVKTIISDPVGSALADVYRPAFVKKLYNDPEFGLKHLIPIEPKLHMVQNQAQLKRVLHLYHHPENQLPLVLFSKIRKNISEERPAMPGLTLNQLQTGGALHKDITLPGGHLLKNNVGKKQNPIWAKEKAAKGHQKGKPREWNGAAMGSLREFKVKGPSGSDQIDSLRILNGNSFAEALKPVEPSKPSTSFQTVFPPYDVKRFAASLAGFAHVFLLEPELLDTLNQEENLELRTGDVLLLEPQCFQGAKKIFPLAQARQNTRLLWQYLYTYPREKAFDFGNVYFLSGAQEALVHSGQEAQNFSLRQAERYATEQEVKDAQW